MDEPATEPTTQGRTAAGELLAKLDSLRGLLEQLQVDVANARRGDDWLDLLLRTASDELAVAGRSLQFARDALATVE